jgi:hypothetical protein
MTPNPTLPAVNCCIAKGSFALRAGGCRDHQACHTAHSSHASAFRAGVIVRPATRIAGFLSPGGRRVRLSWMNAERHARGRNSICAELSEAQLGSQVCDFANDRPEGDEVRKRPRPAARLSASAFPRLKPKDKMRGRIEDCGRTIRILFHRLDDEPKG